jgi:uncharacterized Tic20 family protein
MAAPIRTCPNCGLHAQEDVAFCANCGHRFQAGSEATPQSSGPNQMAVPGPASAPISDQTRASDEQTWATIIHLSGFAGLTGIPFANILAPLVLWLVKRQDSAFVDYHGKEALNFQISVMLYVIAAAIIAAVIAISIFGILFLPALALLPVAIMFVIGLIIYWIVMMVIAAVRANSGQNPRYPLIIHFVK